MIAIFRRGLFWRVYLTLLASLILVAVLAAGVMRHFADRPMADAMNYSSRTLGALFPPPDAPQAQVDAATQRLSTALDGEVWVLASDGRVIDAAEHGRAAPASAPPTRTAMTRTVRIALPDGRRLVAQRGARPSGAPHILMMLLVVAAAVGLAAYPVVSRLTARLERLRASLDAWGGGGLDQRAEVEGADEIAAVAASFNAAADRVESLLAAHKALLAHASHELRSPLTRLRLAIEMLAGQPEPGLRAAIVADIAELDGLVDEILLASRLDHAPAEAEREAVDCLGLAAEEAARAGALLRAASGPGPFEVTGSPRLLRRLIRNLIENAGKHGRPPVEVELARAGEGAEARVVLTVRDAGPGIAEAEREKVFEPFYRPSGRGEAAGSWGLGLSIVRQIAERHGGTASCAATPRISCLVVALPARGARSLSSARAPLPKWSA